MNRLLISAISFCLLLMTGCHPVRTSPHFEHLSLDPDSRFLLTGPVAQAPGPGTYYDLVHGSFIDIVSFYARSRDSWPKLVMTLSTGDDRRLLQTLRRVPVLRGPYGTIFLEKVCFFAPLESGYRSYLDVSPLMDTRYVDAPSPIVLSHLPVGETLTSASLVLVIEDRSGFQIVSGNYEADGTLGSLAISTVGQGGRVLSGHTGLDPTTSEARNYVSSQYTLPEHLTLTEPFTSNALLHPARNHHVLLMALIRRYDYDRLFALDVSAERIQAHTQYMAPIDFPELAGFNEQCDNALRAQRAMHLPLTR